MFLCFVNGDYVVVMEFVCDWYWKVRFFDMLVIIVLVWMGGVLLMVKIKDDDVVRFVLFMYFMLVL